MKRIRRLVVVFAVPISSLGIGMALGSMVVWLFFRELPFATFVCLWIGVTLFLGGWFAMVWGEGRGI